MTLAYWVGKPTTPPPTVLPPPPPPRKTRQEQVAALEKKARVERESGTWRGSLLYERRIVALHESPDQNEEE